MNVQQIVQYFWPTQIRRATMRRADIKVYMTRCFAGYLIGFALIMTVVGDPEGNVLIAVFDGFVTVVTLALSLAMFRLSALWRDRAD